MTDQLHKALREKDQRIANLEAYIEDAIRIGMCLPADLWNEIQSHIIAGTNNRDPRPLFGKRALAIGLIACQIRVQMESKA